MSSKNKTALEYANKIVWVIGATDGIGKAILDKLISYNPSKIIISSRSEQKLADIAKEHKNIEHFAFDVTDYESSKIQIEKALSHNPDCIIYLPAFYQPSKVENIDLESLDKTININLKAVFYLIKNLLPYCKDNKQTTLAITASVAGYIGLPNSQPYASTKAGVISLVESLKSENQDLDIRLINPSFVKTKLTDKNDFKMPMIMDSSNAADKILQGLLTKKFEIHFDKRFTYILKLISSLPYSLYFKIAKKMEK